MFMLLLLLFRLGISRFHRANAGSIKKNKKNAGITTFLIDIPLEKLE